MKLLRAIFLPVTATSRADLIERLIQLIIGLVLFGLGLAFMIRGGIGVAPWDVLGLGIDVQTGLGYGLITVLLSFALLLLWIPLRERLGLGTLMNSLLVGPSAALGMLIIPEPSTVFIGAPMFVFGLVLLAFATGIYIASNFGPGPRDGLMTGLVRQTGWPIWVVRTLIEGSVVLLGFLLGGPVGVGTLLFAFGVGPLVGWFLPRIARIRQKRSLQYSKRD